MKTKGVKNLAFVVPEAAVATQDGVRSIVEGAIVGTFEPGYYKSDRANEQKIESLTLVAQGDTKSLQSTLDAARIIAESQNFTRDLVNEPSNLMTPTLLAERAKKMASEVGLGCEVLGPEKIKELKMGAFWGVAQGSDEPPALIVLRYDPAGALPISILGWLARASPSIRGAFPSSPPTAWKK